MATRAAVARRLPDGGWSGVYNHWSGAPWDLGNVLLDRVAATQGDIAAVVHAIVDAQPGGWSSIADERPGDEPFHALTSENVGRNVLSWVYVFDEEARHLDVYAVHPSESLAAALGGLAVMFDHAPTANGGLAPYARVAFDARGRPDRRFEAPAPPPRTPAPWEGVSPGPTAPENAERAEGIARVIAGVLGEVGVAEDDARAALATVIADVLRADLPGAGPVWLAFEPGADVRRVVLDGLEVSYGHGPPGLEPSYGDRALDGARAGSARELRFDELATWSSLDERVGAPLTEHLLPAVVMATARVVYGPAAWEAGFDRGRLDLFQFRVARAAATGPDDIALVDARQLDPECREGDELGIRVALPRWVAELLRWLEG